MTSQLFYETPLFLMMASLTGTLLYLRRQNHSNRFALWTLGWLLMALHVAAQMVDIPAGGLAMAANGAHLATHGLTGMLFMLSFSLVVENRRRLTILALLTCAPLCLFAFFYAFDLQARWPYALIALWLYGFGVARHAMRRRRDLAFWLSTCVVTALGVEALRFILFNPVLYVDGGYYGHHGGYYLILASIFIVCSLQATRDCDKITPGVLAASGGLLLWGLGWLTLAYYPTLEPMPRPAYALWNLPKAMVAFGMILLELERQSEQARAAERRGRRSSQQVLRYSELTSRLLGGVDMSRFSQKIAETIIEVSDYEQAIILLGDSVGKSHMAAAANLLPQELADARRLFADSTLERLRKRLDAGLSVGGRAVLLPDIFQPPQLPDCLALPMRTAQGNLVGCLFLRRQREDRQPGARDLAALEMLAANMATALDKSNIERQVIIQEKQASMGQMVGGVAHELNNPLTVLIGYCDLLLNDAAGDKCRQEVGSMRREAARMKTIIDNLLRFSRQSRTETSAASLKRAFHEIVELRSYDLKRDAIVLDIEIPDELPAVRIDEAQLKSVLVQLLNNACEAVRACAERRVRVVAEPMGQMLRLTVADSGPGFVDLERAFDPFFSTKGVGRGAGLGLSVCYGVVMQNGGHIEAHNNVFSADGPHGGAVILYLQFSELDDSQHVSNSVLVQ